MSTFFALYTAAAMKLAACGFWLQLDRFFSVVGKGSLMILTSWHCLQTHASIFFPSVLHRLSLYIYMLIDAFEFTAIYIYMVCISCSLWKWRILKNNASLYTMQVHPVVSLSPAAPWRRSSACRAFGATSGRCDPNSKPRAKDVNLAKLNSFGFWD